MKEVNYKIGALKRKFKTGREDVAPGTFIQKMNEQKVIQPATKSTLSHVTKVAIEGMV